MAQLADRHELYEQSVQDVVQEIDFLDETFRGLRARDALSLREDFCGTANAACAWVASRTNRTAVGVDFDGGVLQWGRERHVAALSGEEQMRLTLLQEDVRSADTQPVDLLVAFNFSYWTFKTRGELLRYFEAARAALVDDGVFMLDCFGGSDAFTETEEETEHDKFTYIWDQASYDPVTGAYVCHIHFEFPDGSKLRKAFTYHWRLWTLPEIRELLEEAGFRKSTVYWQGTDEDGDGDGTFNPVERGDADPAWIAYVAAEK
ncbi:MAG: class I SAM-dependent methyltransferase [Pseudomonadota bacterium]